MNVIHIESPEQFKQEVLSFDGVSLVDFRAERCGPCRMLGPIMEELATENAGKKVQIVKVNVEQNPQLSQTFQVSSIPAVFLMKGGNPVGTIIGVNPKGVYQNKIDELLTETVDEPEELKMAA